ncbi:hypothetical protein FS837_002207 [Tulasnella sp. UAMH 9824]|nr:hypothetical protein FS837_002207 [Tulasnella sp. UAMH 9824]
MGAGHSSRASWPPPGHRRKHILALLRINGHATGPTADVEVSKRRALMVKTWEEGGLVSQASEVICEILERVFSFLTVSDYDEVNRAQLVVVSRVNRHWNQVARRLLYRQITLTNVRQLNLLVRTVDQVPSVGSQIVSLSVPQQLRADPPRTHYAAGIRLSPEQLERERLQAQRAATATLLNLLSKVTSLDSLTIHAKSVMLMVHSPEGSIKPPPLHNLVTVRKLNLIGLHDARWLFLLKYTTQVTNFRGTPAWHSPSDDPVLPFAKWELNSLALTDGVRLSLAHFQQLVSSSSASTPSRLRSLELINVPSVFTSSQFQPLLLSLSQTLESLTISSSNSDELAQITKTLTSTLPLMTSLTHLSTNAYRLRVLSPALSSLQISLAQTPESFYPIHHRSLTPTSPMSSPREPSHPIGTIYDTISGILDSISPSTASSPSKSRPSTSASSRPQTASSPRTTLKKLTIIDAPMEDYLHFHLVGSDDWGDTTETGRQNRLWMRAGQLGVLTVVEKAVQNDSSGRSSMGSSST